MAVVRVTTKPTGRQPRSGLLNRLTDAWHATFDEESQVSPGIHILEADAGFDRQKAESMHDWALANGFESELTYHREPSGWELRVRRPGESEPEFFDEARAKRAQDGGRPVSIQAAETRSYTKASTSPVSERRTHATSRL